MGGIFHGRSFPSANKNVNVPVDRATLTVFQKFDPRPAVIDYGELPGSDVNHDTLPWFVATEAEGDLL